MPSCLYRPRLLTPNGGDSSIASTIFGIFIAGRSTGLKAASYSTKLNANTASAQRSKAQSAATLTAALEYRRQQLKLVPGQSLLLLMLRLLRVQNHRLWMLLVTKAEADCSYGVCIRTGQEMQYSNLSGQQRFQVVRSRRLLQHKRHSRLSTLSVRSMPSQV